MQILFQAARIHPVGNHPESNLMRKLAYFMAASLGLAAIALLCLEMHRDCFVSKARDAGPSAPYDQLAFGESAADALPAPVTRLVLRNTHARTTTAAAGRKLSLSLVQKGEGLKSCRGCLDRNSHQRGQLCLSTFQSSRIRLQV